MSLRTHASAHSALSIVFFTHSLKHVRTEDPRRAKADANSFISALVALPFPFGSVVGEDGSESGNSIREVEATGPAGVGLLSSAAWGISVWGVPSVKGLRISAGEGVLGICNPSNPSDCLRKDSDKS
jgi:hypothetical protein